MKSSLAGALASVMAIVAVTAGAAMGLGQAVEPKAASAPGTPQAAPLATALAEPTPTITATPSAAEPTPTVTATPSTASAQPIPTIAATAGAAPRSAECDSNVGTPTGRGLYTLDDFLSALSDLGVRVESSQEGGWPGDPFSVSGTHLTLHGFSYFEHGLTVFVYPDEAARIQDSSLLDRCDLFPTAELIAEAHLYERANLLVLLFSDDAGLVAAVEQAVATLP